MVGFFPYDSMAVLKIFPAIHIMPMVDTINKTTVEIISVVEGACIAIRITIREGVKGGIYDMILIHKECGFCITTIIIPIGATKSKLI